MIVSFSAGGAKIHHSRVPAFVLKLPFQCEATAFFVSTQKKGGRLEIFQSSEMHQWENFHCSKVTILSSLTDPVLSTQSSLPSALKSEKPRILSISIGTIKETLCLGSLHDWSPTWLSDKAAPLHFQFALLSRRDTFHLEKYWLVGLLLWLCK